MKASVGFIGVGNMGSRMAQRIVDAGYALTACDTNAGALAPFERQGVATTQHAADCASADFICAVVATDDQLLSIALGKDGIGEGLKEGAAPLLIVMSTVMPETVRKVRDALAPRGVRVIDAPISGGLVKAADGTLTIMVGGDERDLGPAMSLLQCMGKQIFHCGDLGAGEVTKIVNNMVGVTNLYLVAEAYQLAMSHGIDLAKLAPVMDASSGRTFLTQDIAAARAHYAAWADPSIFFPLADIIRKDLSLASRLAHQTALDLPVLDGAIASTRDIGDDVLERWQAVAKSR